MADSVVPIGLKKRWAAIVLVLAAALLVLGFPPGVPANGTIEIVFDKSYYLVGDQVNVTMYLSNVHVWPIRVQPYNQFKMSRELNGEPYGAVEGAFLDWHQGASTYIGPRSKVVVHNNVFTVIDAGEHIFVVELYTADALTCTGRGSITVYTELIAYQREIVDKILRIALIEEGQFDGSILLGDQPIPLSSEYIGDYTPLVEGIKFRLMTPEEIQREADASGDFLYIRFKRLTFLSESSAVVELDHIWAIGRSSTAEYLSGCGFTMTLNKNSDGSWAYDISVIWIS